MIKEDREKQRKEDEKKQKAQQEAQARVKETEQKSFDKVYTGRVSPAEIARQSRARQQAQRDEETSTGINNTSTSNLSGPPLDIEELQDILEEGG